MSEKKGVEIKRIVIRLGDKEVSLTPSEARELKDILKEMFGDQVVTPNTYHVYPVYPWYEPYRTDRWEVTVGDTQTGNSAVVYCAAKE